MKALLRVIREAPGVGLLGLALLALPVAAADKPLALTKTFEGNINFVGTQASLQSSSGGAEACELLGSAAAGISLPSDANVVAAILYWAGTGPIDTQVALNSKQVTAAHDRRYSLSIDGLSYFVAAADVTSLVKGSTSFTFGGLDVTKGELYCAERRNQNAMLAGFSLVVVYSHAQESYRTVNVYEGLQAIQGASVTVRMGDYVPPAGGGGAGRFGYIVWEGDNARRQRNDSVNFAGAPLNDPPYVETGNAFNAKSGANRDQRSHGIDFDIVDLASPPASAAAADAVFSTARDRVLLGAAIAALPARPADLSIQKTVSGDFRTGNEVTYTLRVTNQGGRPDSRVEVRDVLPTGLRLVSASVVDWTCSAVGNSVTCKYGKPLAPGASASIVVKARVTGSGRITNTAWVSGTADAVPGNDSSTVERNASGQQVGANALVFTAGPCNQNEKIKTSGQGCALFAGPVIAGSAASVYLTHAEGGLARPLSGNSETSLNVLYSLECNNPANGAGTMANFAGLSLPACADNGKGESDTGGAAGSLVFKAGESSTRAQFSYADAGRVTLRVRDSAARTIAMTSFVSRPKALKAVYQRVDGKVPNPGSTSLSEPAFAEVGEPFQVIVSAYGADDKTPLKNFGRESGEYAVNKTLAVLADNPALLTSPDAWGGAGSVTRTFTWNAVGTASLSTSLGAYLGAGDPLATNEVPVGRFYPRYFETELAGGFACLKRMACPATAPGVITRAIFSRQAFAATVRAYGHDGTLLSYDDKHTHLIPQIALLAVSAPNGKGKALDKFVTGGLAANTAREVVYGLANAYDAKAGDQAWASPTAVYVRAVAQELRSAPGGASTVKISSLRGKDTVEGGIMVVNGRLMVGNTIGTPLARTAVPLRAQYWNGMAWEQASGVDQTTSVMGSVAFSSCRRSLRLSAAMGGTCDPAMVKVFGAANAGQPVALPMLKDGKAALVLAPVGDRSGNVDVFVTGEDYLPSTFGRVSFGQFKSPVIYVREMY